LMRMEKSIEGMIRKIIRNINLPFDISDELTVIAKGDNNCTKRHFKDYK
jgi:hypothetical protein